MKQVCGEIRQAKKYDKSPIMSCIHLYSACINLFSSFIYLFLVFNVDIAVTLVIFFSLVIFGMQ